MADKQITLDNMVDQLMDYIDTCPVEDLVDIYNETFGDDVRVEDINDGCL